MLSINIVFSSFHSAIGQISQLAAIQVQQQRMLDPRLQASVRPPIPRVIPQMLSPRNTINTPTPFNPRPMNPPVALQKTSMYYFIPYLANVLRQTDSVDLDQNVASDQGLHC